MSTIKGLKIQHYNNCLEVRARSIEKIEKYLVENGMFGKDGRVFDSATGKVLQACSLYGMKSPTVAFLQIWNDR